MGDSGSLSLGADARGHRAHHRPGAAAAVHRHHLRAGGRLRTSSRSCGSSWQGQAHLPDGAAAPPLRAVRLARAEDHAPLLDRGCAVGARRAWRSSWRTRRARLVDEPLGDGVSAHRAGEPVARLIPRPPGGRAGSRPQRHRAGPLPGRPGRPRSRSTTPAPRRSWPMRIAALGDRALALALGPDIDPEAVLAGQALVLTSPSISSRYPDDRATPAGRAGRRRGSGPACPWSARSTCSCASARR